MEEFLHRNKKICLLSSIPVTLWSFYRGLIRQLKESDFDICLVSSDKPELYLLRDELRCKIFATEISRQISPFRDLVSIYRLWRYFRRVKPALIHAHTPKGGLIGMISSWLARIPIRIYTIHGLPLETATGAKRRLLWLSEWFACKLATALLAVSPSLRQLVLSEKLCSGGKIKVLRRGSACGIDMNKFTPDESLAVAGRQIRTSYNIPKEAVVIGFVGRVVEDKGIKTLIEAFERLQQNIPQTYLLLVGEFETVRETLDHRTLHIIRNNKHIRCND